MTATLCTVFSNHEILGVIIRFVDYRKEKWMQAIAQSSEAHYETVGPYLWQLASEWQRFQREAEQYETETLAMAQIGMNHPDDHPGHFRFRPDWISPEEWDPFLQNSSDEDAIWSMTRTRLTSFGPPSPSHRSWSSDDS